MVRLATLSDIDAIKKVAQKHTKELGFILRPALEEAVRREELLFEPESGSFCHYHVRRDSICTVYEICVPPEQRGRGIAKQMINMLPRPVRLKCPVDNESNGFYQKYGFEKIAVEPGKKRELNVWMLKG